MKPLKIYHTHSTGKLYLRPPNTMTMASSPDSKKKAGNKPNNKPNNNSKNDKDTERRRKKSGTGLNDLFIGVFGVAFLLSFSLNFLHSSGTIEHSHNTAIHQSVHEFKHHQQRKPKLSREKLQEAPLKEQQHRDEQPDERHHQEDALPKELHLEGKAAQNNNDAAPPSLDSLDCSAFGGPSKELAQEMVYWEDIPSDAKYISPFHVKLGSEPRYLTFEPDGGGWNNIRMAMESTIALSIAMGRTLVMPPQMKMYLLGKGDGHQKRHFSFVDFFPIYEMAQEHVGLDVIPMHEYLEAQAMKGKLRNKVRSVENLFHVG
jgi:hypothetical protein